MLRSVIWQCPVLLGICQSLQAEDRIFFFQTSISVELDTVWPFLTIGWLKRLFGWSLPNNKQGLKIWYYNNYSGCNLESRAKSERLVIYYTVESTWSPSNMLKNPFNNYSIKITNTTELYVFPLYVAKYKWGADNLFHTVITRWTFMSQPEVWNEYAKPDLGSFNLLFWQTGRVKRWNAVALFNAGRGSISSKEKKTLEPARTSGTSGYASWVVHSLSVGDLHLPFFLLNYGSHTSGRFMLGAQI